MFESPEKTQSSSKRGSLRQSVKDAASRILSQGYRTPSHKKDVKNKDEIRSQILDHLVERVNNHETNKNIRVSEDAKRLGLRANNDHRFNSTGNSWKSITSGLQNFDSSPVARHYYNDPGYLMTFNGTIDERVGFNRGIKIRDTFTKIFPTYNHQPQTTYIEPSITHGTHFYPSAQYDGSPTHAIDRRYTHKFDEIKIYSEEMLKIAEIADMRRPANKAMKRKH